MTVPAVDELKVTVHCPEPLVPLVQVLTTLIRVAPEGVSVTVGMVPLTPAKPEPVLAWTVIVKVCGSKMLLVSFGPIVMDASTKRLTAGPEFCPVASVERVTLMVPCGVTMLNVTVALPVTVPAVLEVKVTLQVPPVVPVLLHVLVLMTKLAPPPFVRVTMGFVPSGAVTKPKPSPTFCFTVTLKVCGLPTSLTAEGPMVMDASTNLLVAGPELPFVPSVLTGKGVPRIMTVALAVPVTTPVLEEVNVTVH